MHIDARQLDNNSIIEGDICIVGAGAAGISMALDWIGSPYKVILLEGGGFEYDDKVQDLYAGKSIGQPYYPLKSARLHLFGGTTGHWAGMCTTFDEIDFKKRDWVPYSGWPITRADLDPFYARAHKVVEIGPYIYNLSYWQKQEPTFIPFPLDKEIVWSKMWQFSPPTRFNTRYRDTIVNAKNIHLYTYANVVDIKANEIVSAIQDLVVKNYAGKTHKVKAKYFILACCGIQNSRLLLTSNKQAKHGLGNDNDLVGRFFMEHLEIKSAELWLNKVDPMKLYALGKKARAELAITENTQTELKILNGTVSLSPLLLAKNIQPNIKLWSKQDPRQSADALHKNNDDAGTMSKKVFMRLSSEYNQAYELFTRIEQMPNPDSRVTLDLEEKDALGVPRTKLNWVLNPLEKRSIRTIYHLIGQQMGMTGIGRVKLMEYLQDENDDTTWPASTGGGWHHMGTTRMNNDPKQGVVDQNCKVHGISNLFIVGSSCYTTSGSVNPTLTLIALSIRLSDHVKERLQSNS